MICNGFNVGTHWVVGKCISRCMIFVFQCAWIPNLINIYVICKFVLCFFVAVYFYWFYMCRLCSLSCEIDLVNNMTIFEMSILFFGFLILFGNIVQKCVCINAIHVEHQMLISRKRKYYFCFAGCCLMCYIVFWKLLFDLFEQHVYTTKLKTSKVSWT